MSDHHRMKVLHTSFLFTLSPGIVQQLFYEFSAAHKLKLQWDVELFTTEVGPQYKQIPFITCASDHPPQRKALLCLSVFKKFNVVRRYYQNLLTKQSKYDLFMLRYTPYNPLQLWFVMRCKKPVVFVHHTLEVPELRLRSGIKGWVMAGLESWIGKQCIRKTPFTIAMTQEILDYERQRAGQSSKPGLLYPNGISTENTALADLRENIPEMLFVASRFKAWHGLELLLDSISSSKGTFLIHVVGEVTAEQEARIRQDARLVMHGTQSASVIAKLASRCWVGLSSFALFKKNMKQACALKVREYLQLGLPVYADYDEVFAADFPFYKKGEANMQQILYFAHQMREYDRQTVLSASKQYIDKAALLRKLYNQVSSIFT